MELYVIIVALLIVSVKDSRKLNKTNYTKIYVCDSYLKTIKNYMRRFQMFSNFFYQFFFHKLIRVLSLKLGILLLGFLTFVHGYIVKVNKDEISSEEFQEYVNVQKFTTGESSFKQLLKSSGNISRKNYLKKVYLKNWFLLKEAKKKGLSVKDKEIKDINNKTYKQNLQKLFLLREYTKNNLLDKSKISDDEIKIIYERIRSQQPDYPPYSDLDRVRKQQIQRNPMFQQLLLAARTELASKKYLAKMQEKRYIVKKYSMSKKIIAKVNSEGITKRDYELILRQNGISQEQMNSIPKDRKKKMQDSVMNQLILTKIVDLEIKRTGFEKNKDVVTYFKYQKQLFLIQRFQQLMTQEYIKEGKIKITDDEIDSAYEQLKQQNPAITKRPINEVLRFLKNRVATQKAAPLFNSYLEDIIFEAQVKINSKALKKIS